MQTELSVAPVRFPGPDDFQGAFIPAAGPVNDGLQSTYSGTVVVTMIDRTVVEKVLPPGARLANTVAASTMHPVIYLIGDQREPKTLVFGIPSRTLGPGYQEMILLVPFVVHDAGTNWHSYAVRMFLDDQVAVEGGNSIYGYAKELGTLAKTGASDRTAYQVSTPDGGTLWFLSEVLVPGPWLTPAQAAASLPRWPDLQKIFEMPVLGMKPADIFHPAVFVCSYWEWNFANAQLASATSKHQVVTRFRNGMQDWETMGTLFNALDGAVSMRSVRWRLAAPLFSCQP